MIKVLFVCLGNICRSPMAEFVLKQMIEEKGLSDRFFIASAATESYNEKCRAGIYPAAKETLAANGVPFSEHYSRQIRRDDYGRFDYILAMDAANIGDIISIVGPDKDGKIKRLLDFTPYPRDIKDPWYTGNFTGSYLDIVKGCRAFLDYIVKNETQEKREE